MIIYKNEEKINGEYYANLLQRLSDIIKKKRPHLAKKKVLFHQDNAPVHTSVIAMAKINELKFKSWLPVEMGLHMRYRLKIEEDTKFTESTCIWIYLHMNVYLHMNICT